MARKNNSIMGGAGIALMAILVYLFTSKKFLVFVAFISFVAVASVIIYFVLNNKKKKTQTKNSNKTSENSKIKIDGYHPTFLTFDNTTKIKFSESSKIEDFLFFIRDYCYNHFFYFVPLAFRGVENLDNQYISIFQSDMFPLSGRTHIYLAFKNLGKEKNISDFSDAFKKFINDFRPALLKVNELMIGYKNKFREMSVLEHIDLYEKLSQKYSGFEGLKLYEQVCIFEDEYLHEQFDFFEDDLFFEDWWNQIALAILEK